MSEEINKNSLEVECPHCEVENEIKLSSEIKCKECKKSLLGAKYRNILFSAGTIFVLGAGIGSFGDTYLNINRASVKTEYKMMKQCINLYGNYSRVRNNCACAVESMAGIVDAQKARAYGRDWLEDVLRDKYDSCKD
ncbi:MAG: hypothetical protein MJK08_06650 [Campylobacterales bacterium]|nr:hypothetical protein [Campylobacterales bacterium]